MKLKNLTLVKTIPYILAIGGAIGFLAAFILSVEKIELIKNPALEFSCDISPLISCGSVMNTPQAEVFGFPNSLIGIAGFAMVTTIGMALLAGAQFKRWFWLGLQAGTVFGIGFVFWLQCQSLYIISALALIAWWYGQL